MTPATSLSATPAQIERVRKLLALAADQAGSPEGSTALALARDIADRYRIDVNSLDPHGSPALVTPLGGSRTEQYREEFRAAVLAVLAELAGCTSTYNVGQWVGKLFGDPVVCAEVVAVYIDLVAYLDQSFHKWWIPNRFGNVQKHFHKRYWWVTVARALSSWGREHTGTSPWADSDTSALVLLRAPPAQGDVDLMWRKSTQALARAPRHQKDQWLLNNAPGIVLRDYLLDRGINPKQVDPEWVHDYGAMYPDTPVLALLAEVQQDERLEILCLLDDMQTLRMPYPSGIDLYPDMILELVDAQARLGRYGALRIDRRKGFTGSQLRWISEHAATREATEVRFRSGPLHGLQWRRHAALWWNWWLAGYHDPDQSDDLCVIPAQEVRSLFLANPFVELSTWGRRPCPTCWRAAEDHIDGVSPGMIYAHNDRVSCESICYICGRPPDEHDGGVAPHPTCRRAAGQEPP